MNFHGDFRGCQGYLQEYEGSFKGISRVFQGGFKGIPRKFLGCFKEDGRVFQLGFKGVLKHLNGGLREVSKGFQGRLRSVFSFQRPLSKIQGSFKGFKSQSKGRMSHYVLSLQYEFKITMLDGLAYVSINTVLL